MKRKREDGMPAMLEWRCARALGDLLADATQSPFTLEEMNLLNQLDVDKDGETLVRAFGKNLLRKDLKTLKEGEWLNDTVINCWFDLLWERSMYLSNCSAGTRKPDLFLNTYFMTKTIHDPAKYLRQLLQQKYGSFQSIFDFGRVIVPVHVRGSHWCLAVVYLDHHRIQYFDSKGGKGREECKALRRWLGNESKQTLAGKWDLVPTQPGTPQQDNNVDCGVFMCTAADFCSGLPVSTTVNDVKTWMKYSQANMLHLRRRMACRIMQGEGSLVQEWKRACCTT